MGRKVGKKLMGNEFKMVMVEDGWNRRVSKK